ncbi:TFIIB-type zinc ribbon-containing protein [Paracoccus cavernae]|uniref:TFIIB-type zinc ribbon-containing protein n=1 Tax=Paracoccus cavernae TaxID=1571207 RepID=UPI0036354BF4
MSQRNGVEIDYCPKCRGVWLDRGELDKILERAAAEAAPRRVRNPSAAKNAVTTAVSTTAAMTVVMIAATTAAMIATTTVVMMMITVTAERKSASRSCRISSTSERCSGSLRGPECNRPRAAAGPVSSPFGWLCLPAQPSGYSS